jgi:hypothetical protein
MKNEKIITKINKIILTENEIIESIREKTRDIRNLPIKTVLTGISLDSQKHIEFYSAALELLQEVAPGLSEKQLEENKNLINFHIREEERLIRNLNELIPLVEDERVLFIIQTILTDEHKHHKQLKSIEKMLLENETITEADYWDAAWKDFEDLDLYDKRRV